MRASRLAVVVLMAAAFSPLRASALEVEGVVFPDLLDVGGRRLGLVGAGLREVTFLKIDVYAGGVYAERPSCDLRRLVTEDQARLFRMVFLRDVPGAKLHKNMREMLDNATPAGASADLRKRIDDLVAVFREDAVKGMRVDVRYVPGEGITVLVDGKSRGAVFPGADLAAVVFGVWFGPKTCCPSLIEGIKDTCH